jgi:outer membrane lipoprotein-sorting protein
MAAVVSVELPDVTLRMSEMRMWLDTKRVEPLRFRIEAVDGRNVAWIAFGALSEAEDFASHFEGRLRVALSER